MQSDFDKALKTLPMDYPLVLSTGLELAYYYFAQNLFTKAFDVIDCMNIPESFAVIEALSPLKITSEDNKSSCDGSLMNTSDNISPDVEHKETKDSVDIELVPNENIASEGSNDSIPVITTSASPETSPDTRNESSEDVIHEVSPDAIKEASNEEVTTEALNDVSESLTDSPNTIDITTNSDLSDSDMVLINNGLSSSISTLSIAHDSSGTSSSPLSSHSVSHEVFSLETLSANRNLSTYWELKGTKYHLGCNLSHAMECYHRAMKANHDNFEVRLKLASVHLEFGELSQVR